MGVKRKDLSRRAAPIWAHPEPGSRRPRLSRELIAQAALAIADREGFEAVSMRRIAENLGAATMTLYHYVRTKDDLVALMDDTIMAEALLTPEELAGGWRVALGHIARKSRDAFLRHPWALLALRGARHGPNSMRHAEQSMAAVEDAPISHDARAMLIGVVDDFVLGHVLRRNASRADEATGRTMMSDVIDFMSGLLNSGEFPRLAGWFAGRDPHEVRRSMNELLSSDRSFEAGLTAIFDTVERGSFGADTDPPRARRERRPR